MEPGPFTLNTKPTPSFCSGTISMVPPCRSAITSRTGSLLLADSSAREKGGGREFSGIPVPGHWDRIPMSTVI